MSKLSNFLHLKIYRRTFLLYLLIVLIFATTIITIFYTSMTAHGLSAFAGEVDSRFYQAERQIQQVTDSVDNFFTHLYANSSLQEDFFQFFGATPAEYAETRLATAYPQYESYLTSCTNLVADSGYCIRHILYYSTYHIKDMEYNAAGYSRHTVLSQAQAEALCATGYVYTKDIHQASAYVGKVNFLLDVSVPVYAAFCESGDMGVCLMSGDTPAPLGSAANLPVSWQGLMESGSSLGRTTVNGQDMVYCIRVSERFSFTTVALAPAGPYLQEPIRQSILLASGIILVFLIITLLYMWQFSSDSAFIRSILGSMAGARSQSFVHVDVGNRNDEFADIANHLNSLYDNLDALIQQKYVLTIRQQQAQMQKLSAQLNPHFLYNTLERIRLRALSEGAPVIAEAIADLGLLYRNIVKTEPIIPMEKELEITRQYLDLMSFLYDDQLLYHCDIDEALGSILTPKIWMQPIVENFFKHNFQHDEKLKVIVITGQRMGGDFRLRFLDNLGHISDEQIAALNRQFVPELPEADASTGMGLRNVYERLRLYYGSRLEMSIQNNKPAGVCIQILLKPEGKS